MALVGVETESARVGPTFRDPALETQLSEQGVVEFPALDPADLGRVDALFHGRSRGGESGFDPDFAASDRSLVAQTSDLARELIGPVVERLFVDHRIAFATLVAKHPGDDSGMEPHDDRSYVDERRHRALTVWIPTVDTSPALDNGCLHVVPGSHRLATSPAGSNTPDWYRPYLEVLTEGSVPFPCQAGHALAYDTRTVHLSPPNRSGQVRLALAVVVLPRTAEVIHVEAVDRVHRRRYVVDEGFYLRHTPRELRRRVPSDAELVEEFEVPDSLVAPEAVAGLLPGSSGPIVPEVPCGDLPDPATARPAQAQDLASRILHRLIGPGGPPVRTPGTVPWGHEVIAASRVVRSELRSPAGPAETRPAQMPWIGAPYEVGVDGRWGVLPLLGAAGSRWFPATRDLLDGREGILDAEIWDLAPHTVIEPRRGSVPGTVRLLVSLSQPVQPAGVAFVDRAIALPMSTGVVIDEAHPHVIWNSGDEPLALLAVTVVDATRPWWVRLAARESTRLPGALRRRQWIDQAVRASGWDPSHP